MPFNPFENNKHISQLTADDLNSLIFNEVAEGYWVEYKSQFPDNPKVAKSIASFANTYGGWYFIGVDADKTKNVPTSISGIDLKDTPNPIDKLREIIKSRIDPTPIFFSKIIELVDERVVLIVHIPDEQETPFITSDGRLYRRVADSSEPIAENNRYAIDELYQNGRKARQEFGLFCFDERIFSKAEDETGWINVFIKPLHGNFAIDSGFTPYKRIEELLELSKKSTKIELEGIDISSSIPFDTGQITTDSILLKQTLTERIAFNGLSVELYFDGRVKFHIPLAGQFYILKNFPFKSKLKSSEVCSTLESLQRLYEDDIKYLRFFDMQQVFLIIAGLSSFYLKCFEKELINVERFRYAINIDNTWRSVAFSDSDDWGHHVKKYGLPIIYRKSLSIPRNIEKGVIFSKRDGKLWIELANMISIEFGLSHEVIEGLLKALLNRGINNERS